jgi:cytochrome b involved in lipid metabolism
MAGEGLKRFTLEEIAKHKDPKGESKQVWIVLHDLVYDVTKFLDEVRAKGRFFEEDW